MTKFELFTFPIIG